VASAALSLVIRAMHKTPAPPAKLTPGKLNCQPSAAFQ
jgi:hypothetical protein